MSVRSTVSKFISTLAVCCLMSSAAYAAALPEGSVRGLPQNLVVLDESGNAVSSSGNYYIHIEDMQPGEVYTKTIAIMNLRNDAVYSVYMTATPESTEGSIDLLNEVDCKLYLDNNLIYDGHVDGNGIPNMQTAGINLGGIYQSGETRKLYAEFVWNITDETQKLMEEAPSDNAAFGAVDFRWTFSANVSSSPSVSDQDQVDDNPSNSDGNSDTDTGTKKDGDEKIEIGRKDSDESDLTPRGSHGSSASLNPHGRDGSSDESGGEDDTTPENGDTDTSNGGTDTSDDGSNSQGSGDTDEDGKTDGGHVIGRVDEDDGTGTGTGDTPNNSSSDVTDKNGGGIIDIIVDNLPFIPDDVKTGYRSRLVFYTSIVLAAMSIALILCCVIVYKTVKLRKIRKKITS